MNDLLKFMSLAVVACFDLSTAEQDAFIPEQWANESLVHLESTMVVSNLIHRDFNPALANFGDTVNTRRPSDFNVSRKSAAGNVNFQNAQATNIPVRLDQWFQSAFVIKDGDASLAFKDLVEQYLVPAASAIANGVDRAVLGQVHALLGNKTGRLGAINSTNAPGYLLEGRTILNQNKAPNSDRNLILAPTADAAFIQSELFTSAEKRGDGGTALEEARLGRIYGFDTYMGQNVNSVASGADTATGTVTSALSAGATGSQTVVISGYDVQVGSYATIAGDDQPLNVTAKTFSTNTTAVTLSAALKYGTGAGAVITVYKPCAADGAGDTILSAEIGSSTYPAGWEKEIRLDGHTASAGPQQGQLLAFGTGGSKVVYTIINARQVSSTVTAVLLDRPLEVAVANNDAAFPGPMGSFNLGFHKNAIALVNRPLFIPASRHGVNSSIASYNGLSIRASMQYDINSSGTKVVLDMLAGIAILDPDLAFVLLG